MPKQAFQLEKDMPMAGIREGGQSSAEYDVFLSFRGPDTRHTFVDCLYETMTDAGIRVFFDNETLHVGEEIGEDLIRAIDKSQICIPIFSKRYASSKWCLRELEYMMMGRNGEESARKKVMPVFLDISPSDVKLQTSSYKEDLEVLERKYDSGVVERWRKSLRDVCKIKGWNLQCFHGQGKLIKRVVQDILYRTKKRHRIVSNQIIGIDDQVEAMMKLLDNKMDSVRFIVIHGMGGIGKTTLAKVIFNSVSSKFHGSSFLSNIRESSQGNGIVKLQQQLLNDIHSMPLSIYDADDGINEISQRVVNKKILLVLDDISERDQIGKLAGKFDWFGRGSRIIITTRDKSVVSTTLLSHLSRDEIRKQEVWEQNGDVCFYEMKGMDHQHAITLFKRHAFGIDHSLLDYDYLLEEIVVTTAGLPLAVEVIGSYLYDQNIVIWKETLKKLKHAPHEKVQDTLRISYEALEHEHKQIFLDIACFFTGEKKGCPMYMWEACDFYPESGLRILFQRSLIKIVDDDVIWMHDQLRDLGREIVRKEGLQTYRKPSRIWVPEEAFHMILGKEGNRHIVALNLGELSEGCSLEKQDAWAELVNLRYLAVCGGNLVGDFTNFFPELRWLSWDCFPCNFQAENFGPTNLVVLELSKTGITEKWRGWNLVLGSKLKVLKLSGCSGLTKTPNFSSCLTLERLIIQYCSRLTEIDSSIGKLEQLTYLEIRGSTNLRGFPQELGSLKNLQELIVIGTRRHEYQVKFYLPSSLKCLESLHRLEIVNVGLQSVPTGIGQLRQLKFLSFKGCLHLTNLPESVWDLEFLSKLDLGETTLTDISDQIENMKELKVLDLSYTKIGRLPRGIGSLGKLEELRVAHCPCLEHIPREIGNLSSLRLLHLSHSNICELPPTVSQLSRLQSLTMYCCKRLRSVPDLPTSLFRLDISYFSLQSVPELSNLTNLGMLGLYSNDVSFDSNGLLTEDTEEVHPDLQKRIRSLDLTRIERLQRARKLRVGASSRIFNAIPVEFRSLFRVGLRLSCPDRQSLSQLPPNLSVLIMTEFSLTTIDFSLYPNLKSLSKLWICNCLTSEIQIVGLEMLENAVGIDFLNCQSLVRLSILSCPKKLNRLRISRCPKLVDIQGLDRLESLYTLLFSECHSLRLLTGMSNLEKIRDLQLVWCSSMEGVPVLPKTKYPVRLQISNCRKLQDFDGPYHLFRESQLLGDFFRCDFCSIM